MRSLISFFLRIWAHFLKVIPRSLLRKMGAFLGFLWIDVFQIRKKIIIDNLGIAFPDWTLEKKKSVGRESVYSMGRGFSEFFLTPAIDNNWVDKNVIFEKVENFEQAKNQNKGIYFLTLHLGNGDLGANIIAMKFLKVFLITKKFKNKLVNDIWFSIRGAKGVQYIDAHGPTTAFDILKAIKQKSGVFFVLDQFMGRPYGIETTFFGKKTGSAYGLALFYMKTKSPVVPVYTYEGPDHKMHIVFEPPLDLSAIIDEDKDRSLLKITQFFCDEIERIVRLHPEQWMWVHRRWKEYE